MENKIYEYQYSDQCTKERRKVFRLEVGDIVVQDGGTGYFIRKGIKDIDSVFSEFRTVKYLLEHGKIKFKDENGEHNRDRYDVIEPCEVYVQTDILERRELKML